MNLKKKYGNYELHPQMKITGYENEIWDEKKEIIEELKRAVQEKQKEKKTCILSFDLYPGVRKEEIMELANALQPDRIFDIEDCAKDEETLLREFKDYITDDRVFGIMCHKTIDTWFESEKLETMKKAIETECAEEKDTNGGLIVIVGTATELLAEADLLVYCDLTRWEIQLRYRSGMPNWHSTNYNDPILTKYKRGFFIEWRLADRYKKERYEKFTYLLDTEKENAPVLTTGNAFRGALQQLARQPFRMEPYFDPGVWGGHWMKENFGLDASKENFAWSFDGVPEENSLNLEIGGKVLKVPAQDLVFYAPHELLGERVHGRFGAEFPIRFDLLDTMGGQNLSLQVHPLTEYIYEKFGMPYTQDESYYLLDADEDEETYVYLGLKEGVDKKEMERELRAAEKGEELFPAEKYVNKIPVKKHDHVLIPAGTVHCSGKNTMVLEISATPYIFTFKLWDWGRLGMDGLPRPIHLDHGMTRINVKIKAGQETELNGAGPDIPEAAMQALEQKLDALQKDDILVLAGSIPASLAQTTYERLLARLQGRGVRAVVDATRDLLGNGLQYHPFLIKPNNHELSEITGVRLTNDKEIAAAAHMMQDKGARNVLVSLAGDGAILLDETGQFQEIGVPRGTVRNAVGAGDSMVAGFLAGYLKLGTYSYALRMGAAAGSATAFSDELATKEEILKLLNTF